MTVINEYGCRGTFSKSVIVNPEFRIWIPAAFTPNGDGKNDVFFVKGIGIQYFRMLIFSRWGQQIFETANIDIPWTGTVDDGSEIVQIDAYIYLINITDIFGEEHQFAGSVSVVR